MALGHRASLFLALAVLGTAACDGDEGVETPRAARIISFTALPGTIVEPGPVKLSWQTANADSVFLVQNGRIVDTGGASARVGSYDVHVDEPSTFELVAVGPVGDPARETRSVELGVDAGPPVIGSFTAPAVVGADEVGTARAKLYWTGVKGATELVVESSTGASYTPDLAEADDDVLEVQLTEDTVYTLVARNSAGEISENVSVRVVAFPIIDSFDADRTWVGTAQSVELNWNTTDASHVELWQDGVRIEEVGPQQTAGSFDVSILFDTTFELRAFNEAGAMIARTASVVVAPPQVGTFSVSDDSLWLGESIQIGWTSEGGSEVRVFAGDISICDSLEYSVVDGSNCVWQPPATGNYVVTLDVINGSGVASETWTVAVGDGPRITEFSVNPLAISLGDEVTVRWIAAPDPDGEAPSLVLTGADGEQTPLSSQDGSMRLKIDAGIGQQTVSLLATTSYEFSRPAEASAQIQVHPLPVATLKVTPEVFDDTVSADVVLEWTSQNATDLALYRLVDGELVEFIEIPQGNWASGSHRFVPTQDDTFWITAKNAVGAEASARADLSLAPPEVLLFEADKTEVVAGQPVELTWKTRMADDVSLSIFNSLYVREETTEPYVDVQALSGTHLPLGNDCPGTNILTSGCALLQFPGGFSFPFGGEHRLAVRVYTNGVLGFDTASKAQASTSNSQFPTSASTAWVHMAPFWDGTSWHASKYPAGNIYWAKRDDPVKGSHLIIQWKDATFGNTSKASLNYEVVLWANGDFEYRYGDMDPGTSPTSNNRDLADGSSATIGFQTPSQDVFDVRRYDTSIRVRGALSGRTFSHRLAPALEKNGKYVWYPYSTQDEISAILRVDRGSLTHDKRITVKVHRRAEIWVDQRPDAPVEVGKDFRLGWRTNVATSLDVFDKNGTRICGGTTPETVHESFCELRENTEGIYTYRLRAVGPLGFPVERIVRVLVQEPFALNRFVADKAIIEHGEAVTLDWETTNAHHISLKANGVELYPTGNPPAVGSRTFTDLTGDTTFVMRVTNSIGVFVEKSVFVELWRVRLDVTSSATTVRPGLPVSIQVDATALDGGADPKIYGTFPMSDVSATAKYVAFADVMDAVKLSMSNTTTGVVNVFFPPGFGFRYFGEAYETFRVFGEGYISFLTTATSQTSNQRLPNSGSSYVNTHLAPFWDDFTMRDDSFVWVGQPDADTFIVSWERHSLAAGSSATEVYDMNFQVVFHRSGAFEYRYGTMRPPTTPGSGCQPLANNCVNEANGSSATIGYQRPGGATGFTLHYGGTSSNAANPTFPGGLADRAFRYEPVTKNGNVTFNPTATGTYSFCAVSAGKPVCKSVEVKTDFALESFDASALSIELGASTTLRWKSRGGTELKIFDDGDNLILSTTDLARIDNGSVAVSPRANTTYRLELRAEEHVATASTSVDVVRMKVAATAPAASFPGAPITLSWTVTNDDPSLTPIIIKPMVEVQGAPFTDLAFDPNVAHPDVEVLHGPNVTSTAKTLVFKNGFTFNYMGKDMPHVQVANPGYLAFDDAPGSISTSNIPLPVGEAATASLKRVHIAPFWDGMNTFTNGRVAAKYIDANTYVIQWTRTSLNSSGGTSTNAYDLNFMVVLKRNGDFEFRYGQMKPPPNTSTSCSPITCVNEANGSMATIGYQDLNARTGSTLNSSNTTSHQRSVPGGLSNRTWRFTRTSTSGTLQLNPWETTVYEVCALDPFNGDVFCSKPVEVEVKWGIAEFEAEPWAPKRGDPVTLRWDVIGLDELTVKAGSTVLDSYTGSSIPAEGTFVHTPTANTTYTLEGKSLGRTVSVSRSVEIRAFDLNVVGPAGGRLFPGDSVPVSWTATALEPGTLQTLNPMVELAAGPGQPGAFIELEGVATPLTLTNTSSGSATVTLPFSFNYFGTSYDKVAIFADGYISFDTSVTSGTGSNAPFPRNSTSERRIHLAPFWDDHLGRGPEKVFAHSPEPGVYVIQWKNFNKSIGSTTTSFYDLNFEVVLHSNGSFEYRYAKMAPPSTTSTSCIAPNNCIAEANGYSATIGYQTVDGNYGYNAHPGNDVSAVDGGLSNRTFRFEPGLSGAGNLKVGSKAQDYRVCGFIGTFFDCRTITVQPVAEPGDLMITEAMLNPTTSSQWLEVRNVSRRPVDIQGFDLKYGSAAHRIASSVVIPPGGFVTLAQGAGGGFTPTYVYGAGVSFDRSKDSISFDAGISTIAAMSWDSSWNVPAGATLSLEPTHHILGTISNDDAKRWCNGGTGTPGTIGAGCSNTFYDVDPTGVGRWLDISGVGTRLTGLEGTSGVSAKLDLPGFNWPFFDIRAKQVWVSNSGWLSFAQDPGTSSSSAPSTLPRTGTSAPAGPLLAAFWAALRCDPYSYDCAFHYHYGSFDGQDVLVLQWRDFRANTASTVGSVSMQTQLWANGDIKVVFRDVWSADAVGSTNWNHYRGNSAWIGIEGPARDNHLTPHHRTLVDMAHRVFHFRRK